MSIRVIPESKVVDAEILPSPDAEVEVMPAGAPMEHLRDVSDGTSIYPAPVVEGMLGRCLSQCKISLDAVNEGLGSSRKPIERVKACYIIVSEEVGAACARLSPYNKAALNPKHRLCRDVLEEMQERLSNTEVLKAKVMRNKNIVAFARHVTEFLGTFHTVLSENSTKDQRWDAKEEFCD